MTLKTGLANEPGNKSGFDKSTCHGYQDCNVVTSARGCEDDTQRQSSQDRSIDHRYINSLLCKTPKTADAPPLCVQSTKI